METALQARVRELQDQLALQKAEVIADIADKVAYLQQGRCP